MKEKELGERNFGFDSLKSKLNRDMEEKGLLPGLSLVVAPLPAARCPPPTVVPRQRAQQRLRVIYINGGAPRRWCLDSLMPRQPPPCRGLHGRLGGGGACCRYI